MFHEASHTDSLEAPLREAIKAAFQAAGGDEPDRFWHDVIFFTAGEVTRLALERVGHTGYRHYGETAGVYERGARWRVELPAFRRHWTPFLESGSTDAAARRQALERVAADVLREPGGDW